MELRDRQAHVATGSATRSRTAVEIVVTPLLFALVGWWLDGRLGTGPVFAIVFGLFGARRRRRSAPTTGTRRTMATRRGREAVDAATPAVERDIALDIVKRGLLIAPGRRSSSPASSSGWDGAASAAIALAHRARQLPRRRDRRRLGREDLGRPRSAAPRSAATSSASRVILVALGAAARRVVDRLPGARLHARRRAPRAARSGRRRYVSCRWPRPGSRPARSRTLGRRMSSARASKSRPISHVTIWATGPLGLNKIGRHLHLRDGRDDRCLFLARHARRSTLVPSGICRTPPSRASTSSATR